MGAWLAPAIGGVLGGLGGLFGSRGSSGGGISPQDAAYQRWLYGLGRGVGSQPYTPYAGQTVAGVSGLTPEAIEQMRYAGGLGSRALGALTGDAEARGMFMNPYEETLTPWWEQQRAGAEQRANELATRAGAFGGTRAAVYAGQQQSDITQQQALQRYGAFSDAMARAQQVAQMGQSATGNLFQAGDYMRGIQQQVLDDQLRRFQEQRDWGLRNLAAARSAYAPFAGGTGQMSSGGGLSGFLGGALSGATTGLGFGNLFNRPQQQQQQQGQCAYVDSAGRCWN